MNELLIGLVGALLATNQPQAVSNLIQRDTGVSVNIPDPNSPVGKELDRLMAEDDAAMAEVNKWIRENNAFAAKGAGESRAELNARIMARLNIVRKHYEDFLQRYPDSADGHLAYASFLNEIGEEYAAMLEDKKAVQLDPKNPAAWNNLANYYGENGGLTNAFADYAKAIELNPNEPVYYQNLATTVYLFRTDAMAYYHINEQQVFDKALALYRKAMQLEPDNFALAASYAENFYGIRPLRTNEALLAWTNALQLAHNDVEREGVYTHLARVKMLAGHFAEARAQLDAVTNATYAGLKHTLEKAINYWENRATNSTADGVSTNGGSFPTNHFVAPTNTVTVTTNTPIVSTNSLQMPTNDVPALTNSPNFSPKMVSVLTNVPPDPPTESRLSER